MELEFNKSVVNDLIKQVNGYLLYNYNRINILENIDSYKFTDQTLTEYGINKKIINEIWDKRFPDWSNSSSVNNIQAKGIFIATLISYAVSKDEEDALTMLRLYGFCIYSSMYYKYFKSGIDSTIGAIAVDRLTSHHAFAVGNGIAPAIYKMVSDVWENQKDGFIKGDEEAWYRLMLDIRVRFNQSFKSFAKKYYNVFYEMQQEANEYKDDKVDMYSMDDIIDMIVTKIVYNGYVSDKAIDMSNKLTNLSKDTIEKIANTLTTPSMSEELRTFYVKLFSHFIKNKVKDIYFEPELALPVINNIIKAKNISEDHMRYYVKILLDVIISLNKDLEDKYNRVSSRTRTFMELALIYYLYFYSKEVTNM